MTKPNTPENDSSTALEVVEGGHAAMIRQLIMTVPQVDTDPTERMAAFILMTPPEEWDTLWDKLPSVKENVGRSFRLHDFRARESDFEGSLGIYFVCDVTWLDTGEAGILSCSAQISMIQMLALRRDNRLPADLQIVAKDKPTRAGFRPIHLHYLNRAQVAAGDPTKIVSEQ